MASAGSDRTGRSLARPLLAGVSALLAVTLLAPLWWTRMVAPQYRGEEALNVTVYAGRVKGDMDEIELLNQYVGVHLPLDTPELKASPWILGSLLALSLGAQLVPPGRRRRAAATLCVLMTLIAVGGACLLQYRLYQMGHQRTASIMTRIPDFTPPVIGSRKIANFTAHMGLGIGGFAYVGALVLCLAAARSAAAESHAD